MRSDFMDDNRDGFRLIEFNGIAAGMGPFGQRIHDLHHYLQRQYPLSFLIYRIRQQGACRQSSDRRVISSDLSGNLQN